MISLDTNVLAHDIHEEAMACFDLRCFANPARERNLQPRLITRR